MKQPHADFCIIFRVSESIYSGTCATAFAVTDDDISDGIYCQCQNDPNVAVCGANLDSGACPQGAGATTCMYFYCTEPAHGYFYL